MKASANPWKNSKELISSEFFYSHSEPLVELYFKKNSGESPKKLKLYFYLNSNTNGPVSLVRFFSLEIQPKKKKKLTE